MTKRTVLFVCTGNACRSQMAEAICRHVAGGKFDVHSCGSHPAGYIHPLALATMAAMGISTEGQESKSWEPFLNRDIDVVVTVCDAADAVCPAFPGGGVKVHWPMPDPSFLPGTDDERHEFCYRVAERLRLKIERMAALDFDALSRDELKAQLDLLTDL
ncbi:MAG: arsenate reductase ArsC [Phycisphaerales bacterium]|nr:arsenate reductase ArsC [Phycisphaerales bacterium]